MRVLFATEPDSEQPVRSLIGDALLGGRVVRAEGQATTWRLMSGQRRLRHDEHQHAAGLIANRS